MKTTLAGNMLKGKRAAIASRALTQIAIENGGRIEPVAVVDSARDKRNPLHRFFEWDDSVAAEKYRITQAQWLIRHVHVNVKIEQREITHVRAFVRVKDDESESFYVGLKEALTNDDYRAQMLADALADLRAIKAKYATLQELNEVFAAIDSVLAGEPRRGLARRGEKRRGEQ